jgi:integration host factor subunit beta
VVKSELVKRVAERHPLLYERDVERGVTVVLNEIASALARGDRVELRGFGVFSVRKRRARPARNPRTGAPVHLGPRQLASFKAGRQLHERLNRPVETTSGWMPYSQPTAED